MWDRDRTLEDPARRGPETGTAACRSCTGILTPTGKPMTNEGSALETELTRLIEDIRTSQTRKAQCFFTAHSSSPRRAETHRLKGSSLAHETTAPYGRRNELRSASLQHPYTSAWEGLRGTQVTEADTPVLFWSHLRYIDS